MSSIDTESTPKKDSTIVKFLKTIVPLIIGVVILWLLYKDTNFDEMLEKAKGANYGILGFSLIFSLIANSIRGLRWNLLIKPLGYTPPNSSLICAVLGSYAVNFIFPRAGEVWRCGIIAKDEKVPFSKLFGTMIIDRLSDTITVALIVLLACCFNFRFFVDYFSGNQALSEMITALFHSKWLYIAVVGGIAGFLIIFKVLGNTKPVMAVKNFVSGMLSDIKTMGRMQQKGLFLLYTVGIWGCYFLYFYTAFLAFDFTKNVGITAGLIAFGLSSLSMAVPTNGGIGAWHAAIVLALGLYGIDKSLGETFAFVVFSIQSLWTILIGVAGMMVLAIKNRNK